MAYPDPPTTPPIPQRGDRVTFSSRVDAFLVWVAAIIPWLTGFVQNFLETLTPLAAGGANSFSYRFDSATADADPGPGLFRLGSAAQNTATVLRLDSVTGGVDISAVIAALLARTSATKGGIRLQKLNDPSAWIIFDVTGSSAATGYFNLTVVPRASSGATPFSANDVVLIFIDPAGDKGETGTFSFFPTVYAREEYASGTNAPTISANSGNGTLRAINTIVYNTIGAGVSISSNGVNLPAGTYEFEVSAPLFTYDNYHRLGLYNNTDAAYAGFGPTQDITVGVAGNLNTFATARGRFVITSTKRFTLIHQPNANSLGGRGFSTAGFSGGGNNIFAEAIFRKIA